MATAKKNVAANQKTAKTETKTEVRCDPLCEAKVNPCIIVKDPSFKINNSVRHVNVLEEIYDQLYQISQQSGRTVMWLANHMLQYAIDNVQIVD